MTESRLKLELIDGSEGGVACGIAGAAAERQRLGAKNSHPLNGSRHASEMTAPFAPPSQLSEQNGWSRRSDTQRPNAAPPSVFDPSLLNDLAEGLEFLHRQLDDSESELERSREQTRAFENDARRWESEAVNLREEAEETRRALDELRQEFQQSLENSRQQRETVEQLAAEMAAEIAEMRAARAHLETLAAEQQRALVVSLELLKRSSSEVPVLRLEPDARDHEIAVLKRMIEIAGDESTRVDTELLATRAELEAGNATWQTAQAEISALRADLERARAELESTKTELEVARSELRASRIDLEASKAESTLAQEELRRLSELPAPGPTQGPVDPEQFKDFEAQKARLMQKLQEFEAETAIQNAEVDSRGAIIVALENALEEQNTSLRSLEGRFLSYAEQVQSLQLQRLEMPVNSASSIASKFARVFSPPKRSKPKDRVARF